MKTEKSKKKLKTYFYGLVALTCLVATLMAVGCGNQNNAQGFLFANSGAGTIAYLRLNTTGAFPCVNCLVFIPIIPLTRQVDSVSLTDLEGDTCVDLETGDATGIFNCTDSEGVAQLVSPCIDTSEESTETFSITVRDEAANEDSAISVSCNNLGTELTPADVDTDLPDPLA